jgi:short-subunit dehydrogenase
MNLKSARVILTGASGGIGSAMALALAQSGAQLLLVDRQADGLQQLANRLRADGAQAHAFPADLTRSADRQAVPEHAGRVFGGVDVLINNAGVLHFNPFEDEDPQAMERLLNVNVVAPILLARAVLPLMQEQGKGRIVNVGSIFGSIGFPYFASYSASKFALRGFSEALRRELTGSGVGVTYIAPRATRTALNRSALNRMNEALKVAMDSPERVAAAVVDALRRDREEVYLGWPESLFVRLNGLLPRLVDGSLRRQHREMRSYATQG